MSRSTITPRILRRAEAAAYCGGEPNFARLLAAKWVRPLPGKARCDYDRLALDLALDRVTLDGWPSTEAPVTRRSIS
jgi:hypothetical protein